jgi:hypothetical protein
MTSKDFLARFPHLQATEPLAQAAIHQAHVLAANAPASVAILAAALILAAAINAKGGDDVSPNA